MSSIPPKHLDSETVRIVTDQEDDGKARLSIAWFWGFVFLMLLFVLAGIWFKAIEATINFFLPELNFIWWIIFAVLASAAFLIILRKLHIPLGSVI